MIKNIFLGIFLALFIAASSVNASFLGQIPGDKPQCDAGETACWEFCCDDATEFCCRASFTFPAECYGKGRHCAI